MKKTRILSLSLAMLMMLASCGEAAVSSGDASAASDTTSAETTADPLADNLPDKNWGGADFNLLVRTERLYYLDAEEETGDTLNDAVYARNNAVEERFGINLCFTDITSDKSLFMNAVQSSVMADDKGYDIICPDYWWFSGTEGYMLDLYTLDYLDFDKSWWNQSWNKNAEINDKLYSCVGYLCLDLLRNTEVVYFNKGMIEDFKLENPYDLVADNKWTLDKALQMGEAVAGDVDGNNVLDENDRYGIYSNVHAQRGIYYSGGFELVRNTDDGFEIITPTERIADLNTLIYNMFNGNDSVLYALDSTVDFTTTAAYKPFNQNNLLFTFFALTAVEAMRASDVNFGIVPVPKYDQEQEWISYNYGCTLSCIPINTPDAERSAIILEALNAESARKVVPEYYNRVLQGKLARDDESLEMLDMVFDKLSFTFDFINAGQLGDIPDKFIRATSENVTTLFDSNKSALEGHLDKLVEAYEAME